MIRTVSRNELAAGLALWALLGLAWLAYHPGLRGSFLFDDFSNLAPLGAYGPIRNWNTFVTYMLSGISSPSGRPVALLTFLIDANNWPTSPYPFKVTNVLIHLLNGALLAWLSLRLLRVLNVAARPAVWAAVLAAGIWLLHPYLVGITLYVVQRMAMLDALFVMAALLAYLQGRGHWVAGRHRRGYLWMSFGIGGFGLLAVLSKGNGALLPLFVLIVEATILDRADSPLRIVAPTRGWRIWRWLFLYLPLLLFAAYLIHLLPGILDSTGNKNAQFTVWQRLLTQPRALLDYLWHLIAPRAYTAGLDTDNFPLSTSLLHPWTTLPAILGVCGLLALGWWSRRRYPALALAILFYFAAQLLESTFIPLELYFEYRNYLPSIFLPLPLALWIATTPRLRVAWARPALGVSVLALLALLTWQRATLWGQPFLQAKVWYAINPTSPRAETSLAILYMSRNDYRPAVRVLAAGLAHHPDNMMLTLNLGLAECGMGRLAPATYARIGHVLRTTRYAGSVVYNTLNDFIADLPARRCAGLDAARVAALLDTGLSNPHIQDNGAWKQDLLALRGKLALQQHHPQAALTAFRAALAARPRAAAALHEAAELGIAGQPRLGLALLDYYATLKPWHPSGFNVAHLHALWLEHLDFYPQQIAHVRTILQEQAAAAHTSP
ncbi:tetratricopeptide repeat protein [Acidihalobacter ferrooxydans]|uniref:Tetratricopeptide repeat protein n=1 Tax=Acidihalobacter ferrooxydans TaxID=1765967 RepID=A0A1P8UJF6_9GAMM|nr:hypothetical protein [Acidihalobacter ferrooxydans]APZ43963.1 hypothetical protein BW247_13390 [Acidihalobacter ferrooxydans]